MDLSGGPSNIKVAAKEGRGRIATAGCSGSTYPPLQTTALQVQDLTTALAAPQSSTHAQVMGYRMQHCRGGPTHLQLKQFLAAPTRSEQGGVQHSAGLQKKRQGAMSANNRQKKRAAEYVFPRYRFQGNFMALTHKRPQAAMALQRSARTSKPTVMVQWADSKNGGPKATKGKIRKEAIQPTAAVPFASFPPLLPHPFK